MQHNIYKELHWNLAKKAENWGEKVKQTNLKSDRTFSFGQSTVIQRTFRIFYQQSTMGLKHLLLKINGHVSKYKTGFNYSTLKMAIMINPTEKSVEVKYCVFPKISPPK